MQRNVPASPAGAGGRRRSVAAPLSAGLMTLLAVTAWLGAVGTNLYVRATSCSPAGPGTPASPYCKIQDAICASASGDEVRVLPGTYNEAVRLRPGVNLLAWLPADPNDIAIGAVNPDPNQTVITSNNQPCNTSDPCVKRTGSQCSVVTFGFNFTTATRIEGFKITGGKGRLPLAGDPPFVGGGGMYVFSSPTIVNNVITNNILAGPPHDLRGAGIYVGQGRPVISGNVIVGNRAVPPAGTTNNQTYGYGGGIWSSYLSGPIVVGNVIQGNWAGDTNLANSLGEGGGIVAYTGQNTAFITVDRNLIADNVADLLGGGVGLDLLGPTGAAAVVTNNIVVGNKAKNGGGVSVYLNRADIINNTITDNEALVGGGIHLGRGDISIPVSITNNIIEGNRLPLVGGDGGGVYTRDLDPASNPTIQFNLLWGNNKNQVSGDRTDANTIGFDGNFAADPEYVNRAARDFHLGASSPAIDSALASMAPAVDFDNLGRGVDGDGVPDSPEMGDVDLGAFEAAVPCFPGPDPCNGVDDDCDLAIDEDFVSQPTTCGVGACQSSGVTACVSGGVQDSCVPGTPAGSETCNGIDDTCNGLTDEGFPNTDGDSLADCVDPDDDDDGALDASDCAPLDSTAFGNPAEVDLMDVSGPAPTALAFVQQGIGSGTRYEIVGGLVSRLLARRDFQESFCLSGMVMGGSWNDTRADPPPGDAWYYMIRAVNGCGSGTFGSPLADAPGAGDVCPQGIVDADADGSPSDLDCNDGNPAISPLRPDVCNGISDDCDAEVDEDFAPQTTLCGVGACARMGATSCVSGVLGDSCVPGEPTTEVCDSVDNDCNAVVDNGFSIGQACSGETGTCQAQGARICDPDGASSVCSAGGILLTAGLVQGSPVLAWNPYPGVSAYDVVRGSLSQLADSSGDFTSSLLGCLADDLEDTSLGEPADPPLGDGYWYLVRGSTCGSGSYESTEPGQVGLHGPEIEASGLRCP